ncbi:GatB/YqeY domain-containing protein [Aureimonas frigidaquae]|uniref:GatB/YqeY domain-containing protein n=1 Tax=Aureimonas frigidaquae TaxID=424757 RepID=UPI000785E877|nr:GatB/YqeY domain-containing protein [Aureimonas frigidaquae]
MRDQIAAALDDARTRNDPSRLCTLRLIAAAIKDRDIALRSEGRERLDDSGLADLLACMLRQHEMKAELLRADGESARADEERRLAGILAEFLPPPLDAPSMLAACRKAVEDTGARGLRDVGRCMSALKTAHGAALDLPAAGEMVRGLLR